MVRNGGKESRGWVLRRRERVGGLSVRGRDMGEGGGLAGSRGRGGGGTTLR